MNQLDYIVLRGTDDPRLDGRWYFRPKTVVGKGFREFAIVFEPTGELETRADGAVAEVYRPRPTPAKPDYPPDKCMDPAFLPTQGVCRGCGQAILWGRTMKGRSAPFDVEAPHPNHWITCPDRQKRERYKR